MLWWKVCSVFFNKFFGIMRKRRGYITEKKQIKTKVWKNELKLRAASKSWLERENLNKVKTTSKMLATKAHFRQVMK